MFDQGCSARSGPAGRALDSAVVCGPSQPFAQQCSEKARRADVEGPVGDRSRDGGEVAFVGAVDESECVVGGCVEGEGGGECVGSFADDSERRDCCEVARCLGELLREGWFAGWGGGEEPCVEGVAPDDVDVVVGVAQ